MVAAAVRLALGPVALLAGLGAVALLATPADAQTAKYVVGGFGGTILYSFDGVTWTDAGVNPGPSAFPVWAVGYNGTHWVAASRNIVWVSPDGVNWQDYPVSFDGYTFGGATYGDGRWVVAGGDVFTVGPRAMTSIDGVNWSPITYPAAVQRVHGVTFNGEDWVSSGRRGLAYSPDGLTWTYAGDGGLGAGVDRNTRAQIWCRGTWTAASSATGQLTQSTDGGVTWTAGAVVGPITKFATDGTTIVAVGLNPGTHIWTTTDLVTWTPRPSPFTDDSYSLTYGDGLFVAVGYNLFGAGQIATSPDGVTWTLRTNPSGTGLTGVMSTAGNEARICRGARADSYTLNEDQSAAALDVLANDDQTAGPLAIVAHTLPTKGTLTGPAAGVFTYLPSADANGPDSFTYTVEDPLGLESTATVSIAINAVNDAPGFAVAVPTILATPAAGPHLEPGWAVQVRPGPASAGDEDGQAIAFELVSNSNPGLFSAPPTVQRTPSAASAFPSDPPTSGAFGVLRFEPSGASGQATLCFRARDSGGTAAVATSGIDPPQVDAGVDAGPPQCVAIVQNSPPVAYFESEGRALPGQEIAFNSCPGPAPYRCSHDPDGAIATYAWDFGDGQASRHSHPRHGFGAPGTYVVRLMVADETGQTDAMVRTVVVAWPEASPPGDDGSGGAPAPVADAGPDVEAAGGAAARLVGREAGGDDGVAFQWTQVGGTPVALRGAGSAVLSFDAPIPGDGRPVQLLFALRVARGSQVSPPDHAVVTVLPPAQAPVALAGPARTVAVGEAVQLDGSASLGPAGLRYAWEQVGGPAVALAGADSAQPAFQAPAQPATLLFRLTVSDGASSASDIAMVHVQAAEAPPEPAPAPEGGAAAAPPARAEAAREGTPPWAAVLAVAILVAVAAAVAILLARRR